MISPDTLPYEALSEDFETVQRYIRDDSWVLALALCERFRLDALVLCDEDGDPVHCFATFETDDEPAPAGYYECEFGIDIRGWRPASEIVEEFFDDGLDHDYTYDRLTVERLRNRVELDYGSGLVALPEAEKLVEQWLTENTSGSGGTET